MATITYGKGKTLRPTPLAALRETIKQNARNGKVEMPDVATSRAEAKPDAGDRLAGRHAQARAPEPVSAHIPEGSESPRFNSQGQTKRMDQAVQKNKAVRVRIHAPDVARFFASKTHDDLTVLTGEDLGE